MLRLLAVAACCVLLSSAVRGQEETPLPNFFVAPITTQLQRDVVSSTADVYAAVNCNAMQAEAEGSSFTLPDQEAFLANLKEAASYGSRLQLELWYHLPSEPQRDLQSRVRTSMTELAETAGFEQVRASEIMTTADWASKVGPASRMTEATQVDERPVADDLVRVYPVRTKLSRFELGEVDCVVEVFDPIDARAIETWPQLRDSIAKQVRAVEIPRGGRLRFTLTKTDAGAKLAEGLFDSAQPPEIPPDAPSVIRDLLETEAAKYKPSPAMALVKELGFQSFYTAGGSGYGAPDLLVGKAAPSFTLQRLGGGEIELKEFIRGRPTLITFWGLACGPCRLEAPHLSKFYEEYGSQGFEMIAVNAYNDSADDVAEYVADEKLNYPIALQGHSVAKEQYRVEAYPTTFWVDASGTVVDYDIGFSSADRVERQIRKMLGEPK